MERFHQFVNEVQAENIFKQAYQGVSKKYQLTPYSIENITPDQARALYDIILQKFYKNTFHDNSKNWFQNELRLFLWSLVCYLYKNDCQIQQMVYMAQKQTENNWLFFKQIFPKKDPQLFEYQSRFLFSTKQKVKDKQWLIQESELLTKIIQKKFHHLKWKQISRQLYTQSNRNFFRTPKQCRERWLNHLDPSKKKGKWKAQQCFTMFKYIQIEGKKWAGLVQRLQNTRNQHAIKNKYNSLMRKQTKITPNCSDEEKHKKIMHRIQNALENSSYQQQNDDSFDISDNQGANSVNEKSSTNFVFTNFVKKLQIFDEKRKEKRSNSLGFCGKKEPIKEEGMSSEDDVYDDVDY